MEDVIYWHKTAKLILMPIILHDHYHFLILGIQNIKHMHYSLLMLDIYDDEAIDMVGDFK